MGEGGVMRNGLLINKLLYVAIVSLSLSQYIRHMFNKLKAAILLINSESNPRLPFANVFQRQFLGTSFGVATLPTCCKTT